MEKFVNTLKKYSFGGYRTGLYNNGALTFGSLFSVIISFIFLLCLLTGIGVYFNEIFIQRDLHIEKVESKEFEETQLENYSLP